MSFFPVAMHASPSIGVLVLFLAIGCKYAGGDVHDSAPASAPTVSTDSPVRETIGVPASGTLAPLHAESWLVELPIRGFRPAHVSVPLGAREPRPIVVALHGAGDRPEWACGAWRGVTDAYPFIVCPTGRPSGADLFSWDNDAVVEREVSLSVAALRARFGDRVAGGCFVVVGFSLGAIRSVPLLSRPGGHCPMTVLCEGAYDALGKTFTASFQRQGGRRILLACSQPYCAKVFAQRETVLREGGLDVRTVYSGGRVHNLNTEMVSTLRDAWPWLIRDDDRWSSYAMSPSRLDSSEPRE